MSAPLVSVIVCSYNRAPLLDKCLASLCEQRLPLDEFEVIVVDNHSTDNSAEIIQSYLPRLSGLRATFEANRNVSIARNLGCQLAQGEYVTYIDDDEIVPPEFLANLKGVITRYAPDIVGGPVFPYFTTPKPRWFLDRYETRQFATESGFSLTCRVNGGNFTIRRDILLRVGPFDPKHGIHPGTLGEERKVLDTYRVGMPSEQQKVYYALECYVHHHVAPEKMKRWYMISRRFIGGRSMTWIAHDVHGHRPAGHQVIQSALRWPIRSARKIARQVLGRAPADQSLMEACAGASYELGCLAAQAQIVWQRRRRPSAAPAAVTRQNTAGPAAKDTHAPTA